MRWRATVLFAVLLASFAYFYQGVGPNQNSRFDLVRAIVDKRTLAIDAYAANTIDKAEANGHTYSDKAPGLAFASAPVYMLARVVQGFRTPTRDSARAALYFLTAVVVGGTSALGGAAAYLWLRRRGVSTAAAAIAVVAWSFGSNQFAYATLFVAHAFAGGLLVLAFTRIEAGASRRALVLAGFLAGWAAISEYPVGVLGLFLLVYAWRTVGRRALAPFAAGAIAPFALLMMYDDACFGSPFALGYAHLANAEFRSVIDSGFYGLRAPAPAAAFALVASEHRGLLPLAPWTLATVLGAIAIRRGRPRELLFLAGSAAFLFLLAASYARWDGGAAMGPRYFVPALPFVAILAAFGFDAIGKEVGGPRRTALTTLAGASIVYAIAISTACVVVMPELPDVPVAAPAPGMGPVDPEHPLTTLVGPLLARGHVSVKGTTRDGHIGFAIGLPDHDDDAILIGERVGLRGLASVVPLFLLWALGILAFARPPAPWGDADPSPNG